MVWSVTEPAREVHFLFDQIIILIPLLQSFAFSTIFLLLSLD